MFSKTLLALSGLAAFAAALPSSNIVARDIGCASPVAGLLGDDCNALAALGFAQMGVNANSNNGLAWLGNDGPNVFEMKNDAGVPLTVVLWNKPAGDYQAMCVNVRQALITASIDPGTSVTVSVANGVSGAFAGLYNHITNLAMFGGVNNVWGEFTTGDWATVDVSREVNMGGNHMSITVDQGNEAGCQTEYTETSSKCLFQCTDGSNSCEDNYDLINCDAGSQPGAQKGLNWGKASGGCSGWNNGGHLSISFQD